MISRSSIPTVPSVSAASASKEKTADGGASLAGSNVVKPIESTGGQQGLEKSNDVPENMPSQAGTSNAVHQKHQSRPGKTGTQGTLVNLSTNYFLPIFSGLKLYRYSIQVSPEAKGKKLAQIIKDALDLPEYEFEVSGLHLVSDFAGVLLSTQRLADDLLMVSVSYKKNKEPKALDDAKDPSDAETPSRYHVIFDFTREVDLENGLKGHVPSADDDHWPVVQDLDIIFGHHRKYSPNISMIGKRKAFQIGGQPEGENFFLSRNGARDQALLVAIRGFFFSVRAPGIILLNMNVTHGTFYVDRDLQSWLQKVKNHPQVHATKIPGLLKGLRVQLLHLPSKKESKTESKTEPKTVTRTISGYACPGQGSGYEAHPPIVPRVAAGPRDVQFFEYKSTKPTMVQKDKEMAKKGLLAAHNLRRCGCNGSYISVSDYFKRSMPHGQPLGLLRLIFIRVSVASSLRHYACCQCWE